MKRVLIVSPRYVPSSSADTHRVRTALPWLRQLGWEPTILRVASRHDPGTHDALLARTVPSDVRVLETGALPLAFGRPVGVGDLALRAWPFLYRAGARYVRRERPELVFFSTTSFLAMMLGPAWQRRFGTPFVLDIQDMWANEAPALRRGAKHALMRRLHAVAERRTVPAASGVVTVSPGYARTLAERYPQLGGTPLEAIPFGAAERDYAVLAESGIACRHVRRNQATFNVVYAGAAGNNMQRALRILFRALRLGLDEAPALFSRMRLFFVGTIYTDDQPRIPALAQQAGVGDLVREQAGRIPYFETLALLREADLLVVPGVDEGNYVASKLFPYLLSGTPLLTVMHEASALRDILRRVPRGVRSAWFHPERPVEACVRECRRFWQELVTGNERRPAGVLDARLREYSAEALSARLCALFERAAARR